ncbi:hypothetical protein Tsubulata_040313 [Turnera subulata]|uniref:Bifunctional inhibitor/plant lipid transfer protein/seed storage helical domain-containing protein n=1 Tax=Turnera subulata TaxID=218843 RepID=A0A9Q0F660_9ROSI|nr:hypothetical protein Tsubulata_025221 [Turnera subulata]KAJ4825073.1 hypothetical protein Tsubulata_040313 [Turnera subulata]
MASSQNLFLLLAILSIWAAADARHHGASAPSPAASADCTSLVMNMADCLGFVSNGSTVTKPSGACCSGLKTVLDTNAECLCEGLKQSASLGVALNITKAASLPGACKLHSAPDCGLALSPSAGAPVSLSPTTAPSPTGGAGGIALTPAPTPGGHSGSHGLTVSVGSLVIGLVLASFSSF